MPTATRTKSSAPTWTCARCEVTIRYLPGHEKSPTRHPAGWGKQAGGLYCLACRRDLAAEAAWASAPENTSLEARAKLRASAVVEFEIKRDPERPNGEIAKVARCSVPAVVKVRKRLDGDE